jgi:hypothetical protein
MTIQTQYKHPIAQTKGIMLKSESIYSCSPISIDSVSTVYSGWEKTGKLKK